MLIKCRAQGEATPSEIHETLNISSMTDPVAACECTQMQQGS